MKNTCLYFQDDEKPQLNEDDAVFNIVTSTVYYGNTWTKHGFDMFCTDCQIYEQQRLVLYCNLKGNYKHLCKD